MRVWVLYYKVKQNLNEKVSVDLFHYKYFVYKRDLAKFLKSQDGSFFPLCIQRLNVKNSAVVDKNYMVIKNIFEKGGDK